MYSQQEIAHCMQDMHWPIQPDLHVYPDNILQYEEKYAHWDSQALQQHCFFYKFKNNTSRSIRLTKLPDPCFTIIFEYNSEFATAYVMGIQSTAYSATVKPGTTYFCVKPMSLCGLTRNIGNYANRIVYFSNVWDPKYPSIIDIIAEHDDFDRQIGYFQEYARQNIINHEYWMSLAEYCANYLAVSKGAAKLDLLVSDTQYTATYCRHEFKEAYGVSLKTFRNLIRFNTVVFNVLQNPRQLMLNIAMQCGYADHPHLCNDFKRIAGMNPMKFASLWIDKQPLGSYYDDKFCHLPVYYRHY
jgi:AraC-like DNA-binding protein